MQQYADFHANISSIRFKKYDFIWVVNYYNGSHFRFHSIKKERISF